MDESLIHELSQKMAPHLLLPETHKSLTRCWSQRLQLPHFAKKPNYPNTSMKTNRNPVGWFEIYVSDMARSKSFYEEVFAIILEPLPTPDPSIEMWNFPMNDETMNVYGAPGALCKMEGCSPGGGGTLIYFSCNDCAVEEDRAVKAGGALLKPKLAIGGYGFISIVMDTEGNTIGLHSMK